MKKTDFEIKKSYAIQAFREMNMDLLNEVLEEGSYNGVSKAIYLNKIEEFFYTLKEEGDTHLEIYLGQCTEESCHCGVSGIRMVGNISGKYLSIVFEPDLKEPFTIVDCSKFETDQEPTFLTQERFLTVFENEKTNAVQSKALDIYSVKVDKALGEFDLDQVHDFKELYQWTLKYQYLIAELLEIQKNEDRVLWSDYSRSLHLFHACMMTIRMSYCIGNNAEAYEKAREDYLKLDPHNLAEKIRWFHKYEELYEYSKELTNILDLSIQKGNTEYFEFGKLKIKQETDSILFWFHNYYVQAYREQFS